MNAVRSLEPARRPLLTSSITAVLDHLILAQHNAVTITERAAAGGWMSPKEYQTLADAAASARNLVDVLDDAQHTAQVICVSTCPVCGESVDMFTQSIAHRVDGSVVHHACYFADERHDCPKHGRSPAGWKECSVCAVDDIDAMDDDLQAGRVARAQRRGQ